MMSRYRWTLGFGILALAVMAGCRQHCFMTEADYHHYRSEALDGVRTCPTAACDMEPSIDVQSVTTVLSPEGQKRLISLTECIALALENGRTGEFLDRVASTRNGSSPSSASDSVRVFAYDPAIQGTEIEQSLAKFDAVWRNSMSWSKVDRPVGTALETFQAGSIDEIQQDTAQFRTDLLKPLPTGGMAGITFRTDYDFSNLQQRVNPAYRPSLEFTFEQPLLQGGGLGINQIRGAHPGGIQNQIPVGGRVAGILLTRIFFEESKADYERRVQELLFAVEQAYWQLYSAYYDYHSRNEAVRYAYIAWQTAKARYDSGRIPVHDFAQIEQQLHNFRAQRTQAMGRGTGRFPGVLEAERRLRYILGLSPEDGTRLVPLDVPTIAPFQPNWEIAVKESMSRRPELMQTRQEIQAAQLVLLREKDFLLPDLRFFSSYDINALGKRLDGEDEDGALRNLAENRFNNWTMGLRMDMPVGHREAHAEVRRAQLELAQRVAGLRDQESRVVVALQRSYRELVQFYEEVRIQRSRRQASARELQSRYQLFIAGSEKSVIDVLLESQRNWADALRDESFAIVDYNIALIDFERQKGTIMDYHNVSLADGPLPTYAQNRASAHIRERSRALTLIDAKKCEKNEFEGPMMDETPSAAVIGQKEDVTIKIGEESTSSIQAAPMMIDEGSSEPTPIPMLLNSNPNLEEMKPSHVRPPLASDAVNTEAELIPMPTELPDGVTIDSSEWQEPGATLEHSAEKLPLPIPKSIGDYKKELPPEVDGLPEAPLPPEPEEPEIAPPTVKGKQKSKITPVSTVPTEPEIKLELPVPEVKETPKVAVEEDTWVIP